METVPRVVGKSRKARKLPPPKALCFSVSVVPAETVIIAGPTGVGKTALALRLAQRIGGEIVGADAFQIYKGLPLLTSQPSIAEQAMAPHHLVGSVDPFVSFDAGRYLEAVFPILQDITSRGRIPVVVGGTGLYFKALLGGFDKIPDCDPGIREELACLTLPSLIEKLKGLDPDALPMIDPANRRRVERAVEIVMLTRKPLAASRTAKACSTGLRTIFLTRDQEELRRRIETNVQSMFEAGVESEVGALAEEKTGPTAAMTLGLREIRSLLRGDLTRPQALEAISSATKHYAKRQQTWFRNQHDFPGFSISGFSDSEEVMDSVMHLLRLTA